MLLSWLEIFESITGGPVPVRKRDGGGVDGTREDGFRRHEKNEKNTHEIKIF